MDTNENTIIESPILPVENLRQLSEIDSALIPWVISQIECEAAHRRREENKVNSFVFIERLSGIVAGTFVAIFGLALGAYLVMQNHDLAGVTISGVGLATIVSVLVSKNKQTKDDL